MTEADAFASHSGRRRRLGLWSLAALGVGWILIMQSLGWAQTSYYAFVKALGDGTASIDAYHWETRDKSYTNGHFFSVKAPGMPVMVLPVYLLLDAVDGPGLARGIADEARRGGARQWTYNGLNTHTYGDNQARARFIKRRLETQAPMVWALGIFASVIPALLLLLLVRRRTERLEPGFGTAAAITLGMGTMIMPFAVQFFGHVLAALLTFLAFLVVWREREGDRSLLWVGVGGLLAGLAVFTEYPLAIGGAIIGLYAMLRPDAVAAGWKAVAARAGTFAAGVAAGVAPLLAYNLWAFGSVTTLSYANAVDEQGLTGHETLGLNSGGFFGIGVPRLRQALELLIAPRGVLVIMPVLVMAAVGVWILYKRGRRAEALVIGASTLAFYLYDTGYWLPFGGGSPGPRFLIPILPFLAIGLATAWKRYPGPTLALAIPSALTMIAATVTFPLIGTGGTAQWGTRIAEHNFQHTLLSAFGLNNGWIAIAPVLIAFGVAIWLAVKATPAVDVRPHLRRAWYALGGWFVLAMGVSPLFGEEQIGGNNQGPTGQVSHAFHWSLILAGALLAALALVVLARRSAEVVDDEGAADGPADPFTDGSPPPGGPRRAGRPVGVEHHGAHAETAQAGD